MTMKTLFLIAIAITAVFAIGNDDLTKRFDFTGSYVVTGPSNARSDPTLDPSQPDVRPGFSTLALDKVNNRMFWDIGTAGGRTIFLPNVTYAFIDSLAPGVCFIVNKRDGTPITYFDEVEAYTTLRNVGDYVDVRAIVAKNGSKLSVVFPNIFEAYHGLADDAQRCKFPYTATFNVNKVHNFITDFSVNQEVDVNVPGVGLIPLKAYTSIHYNRVEFGTPSPSYFEVPASCAQAVDWCSSVGGGYD